MNNRKTFGESIERAIARTHLNKVALVANGAAAGLMAVTAVPGLTACNASDDAAPGDEANPYDDSTTTVGEGKGDWAQEKGKRSTDMVRYANESWLQNNDCNTRAGCMSIDVFLKVFVKPVAGANLESKKVGVVIHEPGRTGQQTFNGKYFATGSDGMEEWHVPVHLQKYSHPGVFLFTAWYEDGKGGTYYDDNAGEFHVNAWDGIWSVLRSDYYATSGVTLNDTGLSGTVDLEVRDLDYDKDIRLVWTLDGWNTVHESGIGSDDTNAWHFVSNSYDGWQRWSIKLDQKGSFQKFEYAIVYRHGVVNGAQPFEFWLNNGGMNFSVAKESGSHYSRF